MFLVNPLTNKACRTSNRRMAGWSCRLAGALHRQPDRNVVTGHRFFTHGPNSMTVAPEVAQLSHRKIDEHAVDAGERVDETTAPFVLPRRGGQHRIKITEPPEFTFPSV